MIDEIIALLKRQAGERITSKMAFAKKFTDEGIEAIDWDEKQTILEFKKGAK